MNNNFITIKNVALILGVSRGTLRNWDRDGKLVANRHPFNNYRIYKVEDIEKVIEIIETSPMLIRKKKEEVKKLAVQHLEDSNGEIEIDNQSEENLNN